MTKAELIDHVHGSLEGVSKKETGEIVQAVFDALALSIKKGKRFGNVPNVHAELDEVTLDGHVPRWDRPFVEVEVRARRNGGQRSRGDAELRKALGADGYHIVLLEHPPLVAGERSAG